MKKLLTLFTNRIKLAGNESACDCVAIANRVVPVDGAARIGQVIFSDFS